MEASVGISSSSPSINPWTNEPTELLSKESNSGSYSTKECMEVMVHMHGMTHSTHIYTNMYTHRRLIDPTLDV